MFSLRVFFGHASNAEARVYAQLHGDATELADVTLAGTIAGPRSVHAHTLVAKIPFRYLGTTTEMPLAEAIVPDPCFWTPESPYTYQVRIEIRRQGEVVDVYEQMLGIRPLGTRGKSLYFDSRRWVARAAFANSTLASDMAEWRDEQLALVTAYEADTTLLAAASETGVLVVGHLSGESEETLDRLEQLSRWPAVGMVLVDTAVDEAALQAQRPRNLLLGQRLRIDETNRQFQAAAWADFVLADVDDLALFGAQTKDISLPVIAFRQIEAGQSAQDIRAACERLQQELAPYGDYAGYWV